MRRILENSEVFNQHDLDKLSCQELNLMQKKLLIKLRIKQRFRQRHNNTINLN